ncbi:MAG: sigma-54-dependent Fis family transcriptional regulator [Deltaproteobacteria bacterium]|nr:sigma-54-dependent Fis family transcriptional regulator [Deltaproteobacteria bacterium]
MTTRGRVFLLDDDDLIVSMLARALSGEGYEVRPETDPEGAVDKIRQFSPDVVLLDIKMPGASGMEILKEITGQAPGTQVVMLTSDDSANTAVTAMKLGAVDYLTKPFDIDEVKIVVASIMQKASLMHEVEYLRRVTADLTHKELLGTSPAINELKARAEKLAAAGVPTVLITGESGSGKEVMARFIHALMHRGAAGGRAPFIGINCAALPEPLIESELFGHEAGAFTDAKADKTGIFELASKGSILLDEIGEMKSSLQAKLLRVLEERTVRHVGGKHDIPVGATVFATTNRDLEAAVDKGEFRIDLYHRLNTFALHMPPLRDRSEDVLELARHFLIFFSAKYNRTLIKRFSPEVDKLLAAYAWPGNVRELRNVMERIVVLEAGEQVLPEHLPKEILRAKALGGAAETGAAYLLPETGLSLDGVEKDLILQALGRSGGNKIRAASLLGITYDSLRYQIKRFGLQHLKKGDP